MFGAPFLECLLRYAEVVKPKKFCSMRKFVPLFVVSLTTLCAFAAAESKPMTFNDLPRKSQTFVHDHFANLDVRSVEPIHSKSGDGYLVSFSDGSTLGFDAHSGDCYAMDLKTGSVPSTFIPQNVQDYIAEHYAGSRVVSICKIKDGSCLGLNNGQKLCFDRAGHPISKDCRSKKDCCNR